jgi:hypothetical protein
MKFVCDGRAYPAAEMRVFRTTDPLAESVYLTRDGRATFVVSREPNGSLSAHRAATGEIISISRRHGIADLLGAFPASFAPAEMVAGEPQEIFDIPLSRRGLNYDTNGTPRAKAIGV